MKGRWVSRAQGDFENSEYTVMLDRFITHLTEPIKGRTARENSMICQCSYVAINVTSWVSDVDNRAKLYMCRGRRYGKFQYLKFFSKNFKSKEANTNEVDKYNIKFPNFSVCTMQWAKCNSKYIWYQRKAIKSISIFWCRKLQIMLQTFIVPAVGLGLGFIYLFIYSFDGDEVEKNSFIVFC